MTAKRLYWYKRDPAEFFASTHGMSWETKTTYSLVLDLIYLDQGRTPDDAHRIRNYLGSGMTGQRWKAIRADLIGRGKLVAEDGFLTNPRATREFARRGSSAGIEYVSDGNIEKTGPKIPEKISGKRWQENTDLFPVATADNNDIGQKTTAETPPKNVVAGPVPARARQNESQSQSEKESTTTVDVITQVQALAVILDQPRGRYWEVDYRRMLEEGISAQAIEEAARAHRGGPIRGLSALRGLAQRKQQDLTWKKKADHPGGIVGAVITSETHTPRAWEEQLLMLLNIGNWPASTHGICPTRPGHVVPEAIFDKWHRLWVAQGAHPRFEYDRNAYKKPYPAEEPSPQSRAQWEPLP
jgi:uncharacterized protein YdaU (DUF1376 family)